jgi:hypothetical protein
MAKESRWKLGSPFARSIATLVSDEDKIIGTVIPHSDFGNPDCCGCLNGIVEGETAKIECNECGAVVRTVPASDLQRTLDEMELSLDVSVEKCPHCGSVNVMPGFSKVLAYTCDGCGVVVRLSDDPNIEKFFGPG